MQDFTLVLEEINRHIAVLNDDYTAISTDVAVLKMQVSSMIWWFKAIGIVSLGIVVTQFWQLILISKKTKQNIKVTGVDYFVDD